MPQSTQVSDLIARGRASLPIALPILVALAATWSGMTRGLGVALLVLAAGMLLLAITLAWNSVQSLGDDRELTLDDAIALAAPSAEEEKKRAVLRALKDLEYERSVGKISEEDYAKLSMRYREEAKTLLRALESSDAPGRERAERLVKKRLERAGLAGPAAAPPAAKKAESQAAKSGPFEEPSAPAPVSEPPESDEEPAAAPSRPAETNDEDTKTCAECSTVNDTDARFCKQCGSPLG